MRLFLAMLLLSGYNVLPRRRMYWENSEDVKNDSMSRAMSRNRFEEILSVLHCCDNNNLNPEDKMTKVRPLYNLINERCLKYLSNLSSICVDESMLPYYGRHSSKQRIVGKPVRMGYKMWVLAESSGYVVQFEPYQGAMVIGFLAFRREIVQTYLKKYAKPASNGRPRGRILSATQRVSIDVRLDRVDHYQSALPTQRRCGVCRKNRKKGCKKCGCGLHDHCFEEWHGIN